MTMWHSIKTNDRVRMKVKHMGKVDTCHHMLLSCWGNRLMAEGSVGVGVGVGIGGVRGWGSKEI